MREPFSLSPLGRGQTLYGAGRMRRWLFPAIALAIVVGAVTITTCGSAQADPTDDSAHTPTALEPQRPPDPLPRAALSAPLPDAAASPADAGFGAPDLDAGLPPLAAPAGGPDASAAVEVAPPPSPLTLTLDAGARSPNDPRFTIRWGKAGLCGDEPLERMAARRAALLATFIGVRRAGTSILRDPEVPPPFVDLVGDSLVEARVIATRLLGPRADVAPPLVFVYASADQMRGVACVNTATAGYYDGAIHLPASDPDSHRTVVHENLHHVLNAFGLRKPMWLHEGLAMYAADERWWEDPRLGLTTWLRAKHLPFPAMVEAFPHTADELFAGAAYYQSFQMVSFVGARGGHPDFAWLVDGLVSGQLEAQTAFENAVGLPADQLESAWGAFLQSR